MQRTFLGVIALVLALVMAIPSSASAQASFLIGGAVTVPTQDFGDVANTGWMGFGGLLFPVGEGRFSAGVEGYYGRNSHETEGDRTDLYGALALGSVAMGEPDAPTQGFVFGGLGSMTRSDEFEAFPDLEASETSLAAQVGAGASFALGGVNALLTASATQGMFTLNQTTLFAVAAGLQIPFGG